MAIKLTAKIVGNALNGFPRSLKAMSDQMKAFARADVQQTAVEVAADAKNRAPISSGGRRSRKAKNRPGPGELRSTIHAEMSTTDAPVAYVVAGTGKLRRRSKATTEKGKKRAAALRQKSRGQPPAPGSYAMAVEYGAPHRGVKAEPFLRPASDAARPRLQARIDASLHRAAEAADKEGSR